jgi:organic radical activating enzyme
MQELRQHDNTFRFEVETNGTIIPTTEFDAYIIQYNVSPKLSHSGNSRRLREKPEALTFFAQHPQSFFKFVLATPDDLEEILDMIFRYNIPAEKIYLMPEGTRQEDLRQRQQWLVEICKQYGFYYTDRLHIHIYGDKRGV